MKPLSHCTEFYLIVLLTTRLPITFQMLSQMCQGLAANAANLSACVKDYSFYTIA